MEERMLDDENARKIKLKRVQDGIDAVEDDGTEIEASLELDDSLVETNEETLFDIPELTKDEEDADLLSPEAFAELERRKAEDERVAQHIGNLLIEEGEAFLKRGKFEEAEEKFRAARKQFPKNFAAALGLLRALTEDFTLVRDVAECRLVYDEMEACGTKSEREGIKEAFGARVRETIAQIEEERIELEREVETRREQRREAFEKDFAKKRLRTIVMAAITLALFLTTGILCGKVFEVIGNAYLIATIAVGAVTLVFLVITLVFLVQTFNADRLMCANERNSATANGRRLDYLNDAVSFWKSLRM